MSELIVVPEYNFNTIKLVEKCSLCKDGVQRETNDRTFPTRLLNVIIEGRKGFFKLSVSQQYRIRSETKFYITKKFAEFKFDNEFFEIINKLMRIDKKLERFILLKQRVINLPPRFKKNLFYEINYYKIREPIIPYLKSKHPKETHIITKLSGMFKETSKNQDEEYEEFLERKARFLLDTTDSRYLDILREKPIIQ